MKSFFTILILAVFSVNQVFYYLATAFVSYLEKEKLEAHVLGNVKDNECEVINLSTASNIYWEEKNETFTLDGIMYDIAHTKVVNGTVYVYCITENKETQIINDLTLKYCNDDFCGKPIKLSFSEDYILQQLPEQKNINPIKKEYALLASNPTSKISKDIIIPPPRYLNTQA